MLPSVMNSLNIIRKTSSRQISTSRQCRRDLIIFDETGVATLTMRCKSFVDRFANIDAAARVQTKNKFRLNYPLEGKDQMDHFVEFIMQPSVQAIIGAYLESLKNKSKK